MDYAPFTLSDEQCSRVAQLDPFFRSLVAQTVTVSFTKRDGSDRTLSGEVVEVKHGTDDSHAAVVIKGAEGYRSANLWSIYAARVGA